MIRASDKKHRVVVCAAKDFVNDAAGLVTFRQGAYEGWAAIIAKKPSQFSRDGFNVDESKAKTHDIFMSYRHDVDITVAAWIYDKRMKSPSRWFKVLAIEDDGINFKFSCRIDEASEGAMEPVADAKAKIGQASALPDNVLL